MDGRLETVQKLGIMVAQHTRSGNPTDEPMHYGEVYGVWTAVFSGKAMVAAYQTLLNHTGDEDLKQLIKEANEQGKQHLTELEALLKANRIVLPPTPPESTTAY